MMHFGLTTEIIKRIHSCLKKNKNLEEVILYGSRAMGNFHKGSDIDLVLKGNLTFSDLLKIENDIDDLMLWYKFDISLFDHIRNPELLDHIHRVGKVFYKKGDTVLN